MPLHKVYYVLLYFRHPNPTSWCSAKQWKVCSALVIAANYARNIHLVVAFAQTMFESMNGAKFVYLVLFVVVTNWNCKLGGLRQCVSYSTTGELRKSHSIIYSPPIYVVIEIHWPVNSRNFIVANPIDRGDVEDSLECEE